MARARKAVGRLEVCAARGWAPRAPRLGMELSEQTQIWVLSAAWNEALNLPSWLASLRSQHGLENSLRIVLADDGSTDETAAWAKTLPPSELDYLPAERAGKSAALQRAIEFAVTHGSANDLILFTDADCFPDLHWAGTHLQAHQCGFGLVFGHVKLAEKAGNRARRLESALSTLQAAIGAQVGKPPYVRGGNWSTRLSLLASCSGMKGQEAQSCGDDLLLPSRILATGAEASCLLQESAQVGSSEDISKGARRNARKRRYSKRNLLSGSERARQSAVSLSMVSWFFFPLIFLLLMQDLDLVFLWAFVTLMLVAMAFRTLSVGLRVFGMNLRVLDLFTMLRLPFWALAGSVGKGRFLWKERVLERPVTHAGPERQS